MVRTLRRMLAQALGLRRYLLVVSRSYLSMVRMGWMRKPYPELYFLERLVRPGAVCIDIGANLGYYTVELSRLCGPSGRVYAVEPVALFADVLRQNVGRFGLDNVTLVPYALGAGERKVEMGTPEIEGVFRHGCTRVLDADSRAAQVYEVEMRVPDAYFRDLERLDFVKCDIEGYETEVFPYFTETLRRFRPVVQIEVNSAENRRVMFGLMDSLGYEIFRLETDRLAGLTHEQALIWEGHDFYFVPKDQDTAEAT